MSHWISRLVNIVDNQLFMYNFRFISNFINITMIVESIWLFSKVTVYGNFQEKVVEIHQDPRKFQPL